jgi:hypothetical protein
MPLNLSSGVTVVLPQPCLRGAPDPSLVINRQKTER